MKLIRVGLLVYLYTSNGNGTESLFKYNVSPAFGQIRQICGDWVEALESSVGLADWKSN